VRRAALVALAAAALVGCRGGGNDAVAHVGSEEITQKQLDGVVRHFRYEARLEGKSFPREDSRGFRKARNRLLGLLVYRTELAQAADRLGVAVGEDEISRRLGGTGEGEEADLPGDTFPRESVKAQLLFEAIFRKITGGVHGATPAQVSARRNRAMTEYLSRLQRQTKVRYEPGYTPGS
jgi:hypothetical protein